MDYFKLNQILHLPDLSDKLGLDSDEFCVAAIYDGGMGTCYCIQDSGSKQYALKVIHAASMLNDKSIQR